MSLHEFVVEGTLKPDGTLDLDQPPDLAPGRVQVTLVSLSELPKDDPFWQRMHAIWAGQGARGFSPRSSEQVESERRQTREAWDDRMLSIEQTHAEADALRKLRKPDA